MKFLAFFIATLILFKSSIGQPKPIDSLNHLLSFSKSDTSKGRIYFKIANYWSRINIDSSFNNAQRAAALFTKNKYNQGLADVSLLQGRLFCQSGQLDLASITFNEALKLYTDLNDEPNIAATYNGIGVIYGTQEKYAPALENFLKALSIFKKLNNQTGLANTYMKVGIIQQRTQDSKKAAESFEKALKIAIATKDEKNECFIYNNLASLYGESGDLRKSIAFSIKAKNVAERLGIFHSMGEALMNLGQGYKELKVYDTSLVYYKSALQYLLNLKSSANLARVYSGIAGLYFLQGENQRASKAISESMRYAKEVKSDLITLENYQLLVDISRKEGNYEQATFYYDSLLSFKDSVFANEKNTTLENLKSTYELEKKQFLIDDLKKDNDLKTQQRNLLAIAIICGSLLLLGIILTAFQIKKKNTQLSQQKKDLQELNSIKDKFFSILSHDLRSPLSNILGLLSLVNTPGTLTEDEKTIMFERLQVSTSSVLETMDNMLSWAQSHINENATNKNRVDVSIVANRVCRFLQGNAENKGIIINNYINETLEVAADENQVEFVIRNLMSNALKYSHKGSPIELSAEVKDGHVNIFVTDFGTGIKKDLLLTLFDVNQKKSVAGTNGETGSGLGLALAHEFIQKQNGNLSVTSNEGKGTRFKLTLPYSN